MCHIQNVHDDEASLVSCIKNVISELKIIVQLACEPIQMESEEHTQKKISGTTKISNCMQFKITYKIRLPHK